MAFIGAVEGMNSQRQANDQANLSQLQQAVLADNLRKSMLMGQKEAQFLHDRQALGQNPSHQDLLNVALNSGLIGPKDLAAVLQNESLKNAQIDATKEANLARIGNSAAIAQLAHADRQQRIDIANKYLFYNTKLNPDSNVATSPSTTISPTVSPDEIRRIPDPQARSDAADAFINQRFSGPGDATGNIADIAKPSPSQAPLPASGGNAPAVVPSIPTSSVVTGSPASDGNAAPAQSTTKTTIPPMPPEIRALPLREQAKWIRDNAKTSLAAMGPDAIKIAGWEKLAFGIDPKGMGTASAQQRAQISDERARLAKAMGLTDYEAAMLPQDNKIKLKAVSFLTVWGATVDKSAQQVNDSMDVVIDYAKRVNPTTLRSLNRLILAGKAELNDPLVSGYATALQTVSREYARLISGPTSNAILPVEALKRADEMLSKAMDVPALMEVKKVMLLDSDITKRAVKSEINGLRGSMIPQKDQAATQDNQSNSTTQSFPMPSKDAINRLKLQPSEKNQFESVFGPGSAVKYLRM